MSVNVTFIAPSRLRPTTAWPPVTAVETLLDVPELSVLSDAQLRSLAALIEKHPNCRVEIRNGGGGVFTVRVRDGTRGRLLSELHVFPRTEPLW